jgi:hypothetical protein
MIEFENLTHAEGWAGDGTSLVDHIGVSYAELVAAYGEPAKGDGYKTDAQWVIRNGDVVATIYNYKDGPNYCGADGTPVEQIRDWHVGGFDRQAMYLVENTLS